MRGQEHVEVAWQGREEGRCNVYIYPKHEGGSKVLLLHAILCFASMEK